jgi:hypothetical protein
MGERHPYVNNASVAKSSNPLTTQNPITAVELLQSMQKQISTTQKHFCLQNNMKASKLDTKHI